MFIESSRSQTAVALLHIWWYYSKWFTSHVKNERDPKHYCDNLDIYQQICRLRDRTVGRYLSSFAKPNSKNQKVNGQFESLLFTFEPLECDNKEDLCYWNLEFIDRNQSIIVLVFFSLLLAGQGKKWDCDSFVWSESSSGYGIAYRHFNSNIISFKMHLQSLFLSFKPQKPKEN